MRYLPVNVKSSESRLVERGPACREASRVDPVTAPSIIAGSPVAAGLAPLCFFALFSSTRAFPAALYSASSLRSRDLRLMNRTVATVQMTAQGVMNQKQALMPSAAFSAAINNQWRLARLTVSTFHPLLLIGR